MNSQILDGKRKAGNKKKSQKRECAERIEECAETTTGLLTITNLQPTKLIKCKAIESTNREQRSIGLTLIECRDANTILPP